MKTTEDRPDPKALLERFLPSKRSEQAFASLVGSLGNLVFSSAFRRTGNSQLAEEVTQNVFTILARKAESLRHHPSLQAWIFETTRLQCSGALRAERRRQRKLAALTRETKTRNSSPRDLMDDSASWKEAVPVLDAALDRLPTRERTLIIQRFHEGKKFREIAAANGQTEGQARSGYSARWRNWPELSPAGA